MKRWRQAAQQEAPPGAAPSSAALELLTSRLFDYAGMFPPSNLELDAAIWESARSPRMARPGMVGADLVVSLDDLSRLDEERLRMAGFGDTEAKVAVVGVESEALEAGVRAVAHRNAEMSGVLRIVSLETHGTTFPGTSLRNAALALPGTQVYIEPRIPDTSWLRNTDGILRLLERLETNDATVGLKVRGSGKTAVSPVTLGFLLPRVVKSGIPLKTTAGLHHPLVEAQHQNAIGFLGLAAAVRLAGGLGDAFTAEQVSHCVAEADPRAFSFDGELSWRGHAITMEALRHTMHAQPFAIGSCSLKEPDDDLVRLFGAPASGQP